MMEQSSRCVIGRTEGERIAEDDARGVKEEEEWRKTRGKRRRGRME